MAGIYYLGKPWRDDPEPPDEGVWDEACDDPECEWCHPLEEDRGIDQVMEDTLSPPLEE